MKYRIPLFCVIKSLIYNFCKKEFALRKDFFVGDIIGIRPTHHPTQYRDVIPWRLHTFQITK